MRPLNLTDPAFDATLTLRDAYKLMEAFLTDALAQGDRPLSEALHGYLGIAANAESADPRALERYLQAAARVPPVSTPVP